MNLKDFPIEVVYGVVAISGGIARYLNSYAEGKTHFKFSVFIASAFVAGFSGYMFALMGQSLALPVPMPSIMAGVGGFFGDQTLKLIMDYFANRVGPQK